jgi:TorA maturation chaperone TorD
VNAGEDGGRELDAALRSFADAVADDLSLLAGLHDREPTREVIEAARAAPIGEQLGLSLQTEDGRGALLAFARMLELLPNPVDDGVLDALAAGYTDVYLRYAYRASPTESVWMTEDGLERQAPMFRCRDWYRHYRLTVTDWASRPDDHIVLQLHFVSHLMRSAKVEADLAEAARFLDEHLLLWVGKFAERLVRAEAPEWYSALSVLTACYLDELRGHLAVITGLARPSAAAAGAAKDKSVEAVEAPYMPGVAPSW